MSEYTTRQILDIIEANEGPKGLDLSEEDLSKIDLSPEAIQAELTTARKEDPEAKPVWLRESTVGINLFKANFRGAKLSRARLQRVNLSEANLQGANLAGANLQGAALVLANLQGADLTGADLQGADLTGADLQERACLGLAKLQGADLTGAKLQGADLVGANLQRAFLLSTNLQGANLQVADLREVDLVGVATGGLLGVRLYRAKLDHTALKREQLGPAIGDEQAGEYREARDAYLALKQNFDDLGDYEAASWSYIKERQMEKACSAPRRARRFYGKEQLGEPSWPFGELFGEGHRLPAYHPRLRWFFVRHTAKWLSDWLVELVCGYGERPWRTVATMVVVFVVFIGIYWAAWAVMKVEETPKAIVRVPTRNLIDLAVFGLGAFTTMDPKGLEPRAAWVQFVAGFEALLGIGLTGLLGFVLGNRIRRS